MDVKFLGMPRSTADVSLTWVGRSAHPSLTLLGSAAAHTLPPLLLWVGRSAHPESFYHSACMTKLLKLPSGTTCISNLCMPVTGPFHCQAHTCMDVNIHGMLRSTANVSLVWVRTPSRFRLSFGSAAAHTRSSSYHSACTTNLLRLSRCTSKTK
jgi:hypothetical protein